jgi:hypothetical protein
MNTLFRRLFLFHSSFEMYGEVPTVSCRRGFVSIVVSEKYCIEESKNFELLLFTLCKFSGVINRWIDRQTDKQTDGQADTDRQTDRPVGR